MSKKEIRVQVCVTPELKQRIDTKLSTDNTFSSVSHLGQVAIDQLLCEHHISGNKCNKCGKRF